MSLVRRTGTALLLLAAAAFAVASLFGVRFLPILTGSMTPYSPAGSLVVTVPVDAAQIHTGDVIAFKPPAPFVVNGGRPVMHRVQTIGTAAGKPFMTTKGDANQQADPWQVSLDGGQFRKAVFVVPHVGRIFAGGVQSNLMLVAGGVALTMGLGTLRTPAPARRCC
ncbi:signal peptidase I [Dactylosporangium sp. CS-033363]|uniref:signal peptidase I n=1 Tax=Dactylosporangium sp. CS-033363 TaxID=3239935 RepID=UPI003D90F863